MSPRKQSQQSSRQARAMSQGKSRRVTSKVNQSTIGTHVTRGASRAPSSSDVRRTRGQIKRNEYRTNRQGAAGVVDYVTPTTQSRETTRHHKRRMGARGFAGEAKTHSTIKWVLSIIAVLAILVGVGVGVGSCVFRQTVANNMAFDDETIGEFLTKPAAGQPYNILIAADITPLDGSLDGIDAMILARVDEAARKLTLLNIPSNVQVRFSDGDIYLASDAPECGGDVEAIRGLIAFLDEDIAHYVKLRSDGLMEIVDYLEGVHANITEEIDDPSAGSIYIPTGETELSGEQALTYLNATNFYLSVTQKHLNQCTFMASLCEKLFDLSDATHASFIDMLSQNMKSDMSADELGNLLKTFHGVKAADILYGYVPGYDLTHDGITSYIVYETTFATVWEKFKAGEDPLVREDEHDPVDRSSFKIEVRNGSGVDSGASRIAQILKDATFNVVATGNAESYVYTETLVIYRRDDLKYGAQEIVETLGCGRAVQDVGFYIFETDVLVVLGSDWKPELSN